MASFGKSTYKDYDKFMENRRKGERELEKGIVNILNQRPPLAYFVVVMRE